MADQPTYRVLTRVHVNQWDDQLQTAVPGWQLNVLWTSTGTVLPVFVADVHYDAPNVDALVRAAGAKDDAIHALGA